LASLSRLAPIGPSDWQTSDEAFAQAEFARVADLLPQGQDNVEENEQAARLIPHRRFRGPTAGDSYARQLDEAGRDEWWRLCQRIAKEASRTVSPLAQYWADGRRTIAEIGQLIGMETGLHATPLLLEYFRFMERLGIIELEEGK
jgi:hypothetical protein